MVGDEKKLRRGLGNQLDAVGQEEFILFVPYEGANVPIQHWSERSLKSFSRNKREMGLSFQNVYPFSFQATVTGTWETTLKNTLLQMFYTMFALHRNGVEDAGFFGIRQKHTALFVSGDDVFIITSRKLDDTIFFETFKGLHQILKFMSKGHHMDYLSMTSFTGPDGEEVLFKNLFKVFQRTSYVGRNVDILRNPGLYYIALLVTAQQMGVSRLYEDIIRAFMVGAKFPTSFDKGVIERLTQSGLFYRTGGSSLEYKYEG